MAQADAPWHIPGLAPKEIEKRRGRRAKASAGLFSTIQQHAQPKQRTEYTQLKLMSFTYEYRSQTNPDNPPYQIVIHYNSRTSFLSGTCTCPYNVLAMANPHATTAAMKGKTWCKHLCALALLLVDPAKRVASGTIAPPERAPSGISLTAGLADPREPDAHDHADDDACDCLTTDVRARLLKQGPVDAKALHELCEAPPLFRVWFLRRLGFLRPVPACTFHPDTPLRPTVTKDGRVIYRCRCLKPTGVKPTGKRKRDADCAGGSDQSAGKARQYCNTTFAAHKDSPFYNAKLSEQKILLLTWCWVSKMAVSAAAKYCTVNTETVYSWYAKFRSVTGDINSKLSGRIWGSEKMGGPGKTVQVDESKFGKRYMNLGKRVKGMWVQGIVSEEQRGRVVLEPLRGRDADSILPVIRKHVAPGTIVKSDGLALYKTLPKEGYRHAAVIHDNHLKDPFTGIDINHMEGTWTHAKHVFPRGGIGMKKETHAGYLNMYAYERMVRDKYPKADPFLVFLRLWGEAVKVTSVEK